MKGTHIRPTIARSGREQQDSTDKVDDERKDEEHPDAVERQDGRAVCFGNLLLDVVEEEGEGAGRPIVAAAMGRRDGAGKGEKGRQSGSRSDAGRREKGGLGDTEGAEKKVSSTAP